MPDDKSVNNKRIAKNTIMLYIRMLLILSISLYTSRIVLKTLGENDYGIYNVVGGIVAMLGFINAAMSTSTQRYLTFELGKKNILKLREIFATSFSIHAIIALVIVIIAETAGLWFLNNKMIIPEDRMYATQWCYQLSVFASVIAVLNVPYNSVIIAHEKMSAFAYISIFEAVAKLIIVYILLIGEFDKLILYAILMLIVQVSVIMVYRIYCVRHFEEAKLNFILDKNLFKEMLVFSGWNLWGNFAFVLYTQGLNILLNVFFGPAVNAARGIAVQVQGAVSNFSSNFQMAVNPQITKAYAQNDFEGMFSLIYAGSKITFMLLFALSFPVMMETEAILALWLENVPEFTAPFVQIILACMIVNATAGLLMQAASATGNVKMYQSVVGGLLLSILPLSYVALKMGGNPVSVFVVQLGIFLVSFAVRLHIVKKLIPLSISLFIKKVILRCFAVSTAALTLTLPIKMVLARFQYDGFVASAAIISVAFISALVSAYLIGFDKNERVFVKNKIRKIIKH